MPGPRAIARGYRQVETIGASRNCITDGQTCAPLYKLIPHPGPTGAPTWTSGHTRIGLQGHLGARARQK